MIPIGDARARLVALADAPGRRLSRAIAARRTQPARDLSAMDGYALRARDAGGVLRLVGESAAGRPFARPIGAGETVRIFTGAALPDGADCVLIQENVAVDEGAVRQVAGVAPLVGRHVRRAGFDFRAGDVMADAGAVVTARTIGLAAAAGHATLDVWKRVRVAILSTGDELVAPGAALGADGLPSSNAAMLAAMLAEAGADVADNGIVRDDVEAIRAAITGAAATADLLVTTGGASVGDHDLVRPALAAAGAAIDFWRVAMRPGKPLIAGRLGDTLVLGLPGNPVSALVCGVLFLLPALARLSGLPAGPVPTRPARAGRDPPANDRRQDYLRAGPSEGGAVATPWERQDSGMLGHLARADALLVRAPHAPALAAGAVVDVVDLAELGV